MLFNSFEFLFIFLPVMLNIGCILKISCLVTLETLDLGEVVVVIVVIVIPRENKVQLQPGWAEFDNIFRLSRYNCYLLGS